MAEDPKQVWSQGNGYPTRENPSILEALARAEEVPRAASPMLSTGQEGGTGRRPAPGSAASSTTRGPRGTPPPTIGVGTTGMERRPAPARATADGGAAPVRTTAVGGYDPLAIRGGRIGQAQEEHHAEVVRQMGGPTNYMAEYRPEGGLDPVDDIASGRLRNNPMVSMEAKIIMGNDTERDITNAGLLTQNIKYARIPMGKHGGLEPTEEFNKYRFAEIWMNDQMKRLLKTSASPEDVYGQMKILGFGALAEGPDGMFSEKALLDFATTAAKDVSDWRQHRRGLTKERDPVTGGEIWKDKRTINTDPNNLSRMEGESHAEWGARLSHIRGRPGAAGLTPKPEKKTVRRKGSSYLDRRQGESLQEWGARLTPSSDPSGGLF